MDASLIANPAAPSQVDAVLTAFSAAELLAIAPDEPEQLFGLDPQDIKHDYRALVSHWQVQEAANPQSADVVAHLATLFGMAQLKLRAGTWSPPGVLVIKQDGKKKDIQLPYILKRDFELGKVFICNDSVVYKIDKEHAALAKNAAQIISKLPMADDDMRKQMERFVPTQVSTSADADSVYLSIPRSPDMVALRDVLDHVGGKVPPEHVAWIVSSLMNTACYLSYAGLSHGDLSLDTVFVSPERHSCAVLGGWWYAAKIGEQLPGMAMRTAVLAPAEVLQTNEADPRVDLDLIRALGRELSGDPDGSLSMAGAGSLPAPMADWLNGQSSGKPIDEYGIYREQVLPESFGPRRFVKWAISPTTLYPPRR